MAWLAATAIYDPSEAATSPIASTDPIAALANSATTGRPAPPAVTELFALTIRMNQTETGLVLPVMRREGRWLMDRDDLARLPARPPQGWDALPLLVALDQEGGFATRFDANEQILELEVPASWLAHQVTKMGEPSDRSPAPPMTGPAGLVVNYDVNYSQSVDFSRPETNAGQLAALTEIRLFNEGTGVLSHTQLNQVGYAADGVGRQTRSVRLESWWQETRPDTLFKWRFGDGITDSGTGMRPIRFGGIWLGSDFDLQPYRTTNVLPSWFGSVNLPSTVDVYIDGMRRYHAQVPPGAVALDAVPGVTGSGMATVVLTDVLGRMQTIELPFYATTRLLKEGMLDWSASLGVARLGYGQESNHYDSTLVGSGRVRYGFSSFVTGEFSAEATEGVRTLGLLGVVGIGQFGILAPRLSASDASHPDGHGYFGGSQLGLGYEWSNRRFSLNLDYTRSTAGYRDVASRFGSYWASLTQRAGLGWNLARYGMVGLSWIRQIEHNGHEGRYLSANWYRSFAPNWGVQLTVSRSLTAQNETIAVLGVTRMLGQRRSTNVNHQMGRDRSNTSVALTQSMTAEARESWRVQAATGNGDPSAQLDLAREWSRLRGQAQLYARGERLSGWAGAQGALAWVGGHRLAARSLPDAFALVSTAGVPDVPIRLENRLIGQSDSEGLLVTPLYSWISNRVSVDALDLPPDLRIDTVQQQVVGRGKAGSLIRFPLRRVRAATVVLVDEVGRPLEQGLLVRRVSGKADVGAAALAAASAVADPGAAAARSAGTAAAAADAKAEAGFASDAVPDASATQMGYDGELWLEGLDEHDNQLEVGDPSRRCVARFDFPTDASTPTRIGPVICHQDMTREMI